jgi:hypothetical protein
MELETGERTESSTAEHAEIAETGSDRPASRAGGASEVLGMARESQWNKKPV